MAYSTLFNRILMFAVGKIKKGLKSPWTADRRVTRVDSSTRGGAPRYENQCSDNKTAHDRALPSRTACIGIVAELVKSNTAAIWRRRRQRASNVRLKSTWRAKRLPLPVTDCHGAAAISRWSRQQFAAAV